MDQIEPMDIDNIDNDFDNKENSFHHNNVLPQAPCTEKGYEELDVSELNMKLRYSITPASSPMSKSLTAYSLDSRSFDSENYINNVVINENSNLTHSYNPTIIKNDTAKSLKSLPLQALSTEQIIDNRSMSTLRLFDATFKSDDNNVTITLSGPDSINDNVSSPSTSSSVAQTPEATTPTKDIPKHDGGSPIMRGIKSVLNMFRSSQSPIPTDTNNVIKPEVLSPSDFVLKDDKTHKAQQVLASTPIANKTREGSGSQRSSPLKESIVFNDDLETELQWKDETTILFKEEKIPIHRLFLPQTLSSITKTADVVQTLKIKEIEILDGSVEYMDISNNDSLLETKVPINIQPMGISNMHEVLAIESDGEFVDCETTLNDDVNITKEIISNGESSGEKRIIENNYLQNSIVVQCNENMVDKQLISNNKPIADMVLTLECKPENILSLASEASKQTGECNENIFSKSILANCNLENKLIDPNTSECSVNNQSMEALVTVKNTDEFALSVNKDMVEDDFYKEMVSANITKQNIVHSITQYDEVELKPSVCTDNITPISISLSGHIERNCGKKSEDHDEIRLLPSDIPLPIDDDDDDVKNVISSGNTDCLSALKSEDIKMENNVNKEELNVTVKNQTDVGVEHKDLPTYEDSYSEHVASITNVVSLSSVKKENIVTEEEFTNPVNENQNIKNELQKSQDEITIDSINESTEHTTSECKENQKLQITENHILDVIDYMHELPEIEKNKNVSNSAQIIPNDVYINDEHSCTIECNDQVVIENIVENRLAENLDTNHVDVPKSESNDCKYDNDNLIKTKKIGGLINSTEHQNKVVDTNQINIECNETSLNREHEATLVSEGDNPDHQKSSEIFDHFDNVTGTLNFNQLVSTKSTNIELNRDTDKIQPFDQVPKGTSIILSNKVMPDEKRIKDMANNQLINTEENNSDNSLANTIKSYSGEEDTEDLTNILVTDKINIIDLHNDINRLKQSAVNTGMDTIEMEVPKKVNSDLFEPMDQVEVTDEIYFYNITPESEKAFKTTCKHSEEEDLKINTNGIRHLNDLKTNQMIAVGERQGTNISGPLKDIATTFENTKISNHVFSEDKNKISPQETPDMNATFNMNISQGEEFENKDFQVSSESCNHERDQDTNIIQDEPQIICNNVDHRQNEILKNSHSNIDIVSYNEACNSKCFKYSVNINESNTITNTNVISVIEAITQAKSDENKGRKLNISNVSDLPKEFSEETNTMCIPDILDAINQSQSIQKQSSVNPISCIENYSETELQCINLIENLEINTTQQQIHTDNNRQLPNTYTVTDFRSKGKECEQEAEFTQISEDNLLHINKELDNINKPALKTNMSPPLSPKISSKGYKLNFDEIDDPFATKTKIRLSPPPEGTPKLMSSTEKFKPTNKNTKHTNAKKDLTRQRRESQPEIKKQPTFRNKINSTSREALVISEIKKANENTEAVKLQESTLDNHVVHSISNDNCHVLKDVVIPSNLPELDTLVETIDVSVCQTEKYVNSIEVSDDPLECGTQIRNMTYTDQIACTINDQFKLPAESYELKNVFNLPEMSSDMNFNPFISKSRVCRSPSPTLEVKDTSAHVLVSSSKDRDGKNNDDIDDIQIADKIEQDSSIASSSSKATVDATVREVNTEDEDTIEGPFFETDNFNADQLSDVIAEHDDMMHFSDIPTTLETDDNADNGEMFIDAEAFEFLLNQNKSNVVVDSGKESLFLKFDPLFAKRMSSDSVLAALSKVQKRQSTPKRISKAPTIDVTYCDKLSPGPLNLDITRDAAETNYEDPNVTVSKPMMVVNPAVNSIVTPRNKTCTPPKTNRRSLTFTSPAIAVIDRLLSLSGNSSTINHETTIAQVQREQNETDLALTQLRELLAEKEIHVHNLRSESKELKERLSVLESQVSSLETESERRLKNVNELNERLTEKTKINKSMAAVVEEYERTIASLIAETEQDKKQHMEERMRLVNERDEQTAHLASMEISFNDLHSKYEKSKQIILSYKANEDAYKKSIKEFEDSLVKMQNNYELLKQHATSKLTRANQELERCNKAHEAETLKLNAMMKRKELHITSLEESLAQKTKANEELAAICDELINKVG